MRLLLLLATLAPFASAQDYPKQAGKIALLGSLHAHSALSGDVSDSKGFSPQECFEHARENELDSSVVNPIDIHNEHAQNPHLPYDEAPT